MAKQQPRQGAAPAAPSPPDRSAEPADVAAAASTAIVATEATAVIPAEAPAPASTPAPRDWRAEIRQLAEFLQQAADTEQTSVTPPTYYVLDVPTTGEPHCYRFATKAGLVSFLRGLEIKREQLERAVYVFAGERIHITKAPRHLLFEGSRIALFAAVEELDAQDDTLSPEDEEQSSETET